MNCRINCTINKQTSKMEHHPPRNPFPNVKLLDTIINLLPRAIIHTPLSSGIVTA